MDKICLYTRQHENSLNELRTKGKITNKEIYVKLHMGDIADFFVSRYRRFVEMAEKIVPRPEDSDYPIWCSVSRENCLKPIAKEVVYCLEVPSCEIIYFDGGKWDYVLNNLYIPLDEADDKRFTQEIESLGVRNRFEFIDGRYRGRYPEIEKEITDSWERIFIIDDWNMFTVQANLWHIREEWIRHIVYPGEDLMKIANDMPETFPPHILME